MAKLDLLTLVANERKAAIGFENDATLLDEREKSLEYAKGQMRDVPALPMRSKAVSTDVNDAIETLLPDLVEIFTGTDDVVAFTPTGEEDEQAAQQETDYINHVVFHENDGFMLLYTGFKDALTVKTGVWTWWWEDYRYAEEEVEVAGPEDLQGLILGAQEGKYEVIDVKADEDDGATSLKVTLKKPDGGGCVRIKAWPPEDFAVAKDTVRLADATYCAARSYPRAQDLIADGYDEAKVNKLPVYVMPDEQIERARSTAGEEDQTNDTTLRQVEIITHFIRVVEGRESKLYRVVTGADETVLLEKDEVEHIQFAAVTPYPVAHRFFGRSVADLVMEIQRIRTSLVRMMLDSGYFALNQRVEVAEDRATPNTIADLLRNEPGVPIRSKGDALKPVTAGALAFDVQGALEFTATMSEQRTGIIRNAQGINPDTLHDTAKGAAQQLGQALKRTRLIARVFAETGVKDLFMGVHATIRAHATRGAKARLRNKWVEIDPTSWGSRNDMTIELGVGAGGREHEMQKAQMLGEVIQTAIQAPGAASMFPPEKIYHATKKAIEAIGYKDPDAFIANPKDAAPQQPQPDPEVVKAQADMELQRQKAENELIIARERMNLEAELRREEAAQQLMLDRERAVQEAELRREQFQYEAQLNAQANAMRASQPDTSIGPVRDGGAVG